VTLKEQYKGNFSSTKLVSSKTHSRESDSISSIRWKLKWPTSQRWWRASWSKKRNWLCRTSHAS